MGKFCHRCGNKLREGAKFCNRCGGKLKTLVNLSVSKSPIQPVKIKTDLKSGNIISGKKKKIIGTPRVEQKPTLIERTSQKRVSPPKIIKKERQVLISQKIPELKKVENKQQQFDQLLRTKISRLEDQINNFERRNRFSKFDFENIERLEDELREFIDQKYFANSEFKQKYIEIKVKKEKVSFKILEYLTHDFSDAKLEKTREIWQRNKIDIQQTLSETQHIGELMALGKVNHQITRKISGILGRGTNEKINPSILYANNPQLRELFLELHNIQIPAYIEKIDPSNHKNIFNSELDLLKNITNLMGPVHFDRKTFTSRYLFNLNKRYIKEQIKTKNILITVKKSLDDHYTDINIEYQQLKGNYYQLMEQLVYSGDIADQLFPQQLKAIDDSPGEKDIVKLFEFMSLKSEILELKKSDYYIPFSKDGYSKIENLEALNSEDDIDPLIKLDSIVVLKKLDKANKINKTVELKELEELN